MFTTEMAYFRRGRSKTWHAFWRRLDDPNSRISLCERHEFGPGGYLYSPWPHEAPPDDAQMCQACLKEMRS